MGSSLSPIYPDRCFSVLLIQNFQFSSFYELFPFSLTWDHIGAKTNKQTKKKKQKNKKQKKTNIPSEATFMINKVVMGEHKGGYFGDLPKILWHFEIFVNMGLG